MVEEHVQVQILRYRDAAQPTVLLTVTGAHGSSGENAPLPVAVERGHVSVSVITRLLATVVGRVQETPLSCPGVTAPPAQVEPRRHEEAS